MKLIKSFLLALVVCAMMAVSAFADPPSPPTPQASPSVTQKQNISGSNVKATGVQFNSRDEIFSAVRTVRMSNVFTLTNTAFQNHALTADAGNLQKRIALGLATENPFYKYRNFFISGASDAFERETFFNLKVPVSVAGGSLIYDLPPNLRASCAEHTANFHSPVHAYRFRQDRSRFV